MLVVFVLVNAPNLDELVSLYDDMGRLEEAMTFYRQSADIYTELKDMIYEGTVRSNIDLTLIPF